MVRFIGDLADDDGEEGQSDHPARRAVLVEIWKLVIYPLMTFEMARYGDLMAF